jgi:uncharacterized OsmC-like protein
MNSKELKSLQAPLKQKYRDNPEAATITLSAEGNIGEGISCKVETGRALKEAGLHPATGGTGLLACSGDMLLESLVACAGVTLKSVSTSMGVDITEGIVKAEGVLDVRGTLGVSGEASVGFKEIRLSFILESDVSAEQLLIIKKLTEKYCVVYQTLIKGVSVETAFRKK